MPFSICLGFVLVVCFDSVWEIKVSWFKNRLFCFRKITMGLLRRLLEQDLKLEKYSLDPYKKFINGELDEVSNYN
jgi:hypothetical protein